MTTAKERDSQEAAAELREILKPGDTVFTVLRHRSSSGMSRAVDCYKLACEDDAVRPYWLSRLVARAAGFRFDDRRDAVSVGGAGMDMGFHVIYSLSRVLYRTGFECIGDHCPSKRSFKR